MGRIIRGIVDGEKKTAVSAKSYLKMFFILYRLIKSIHLVQYDHCGVKLDCKLKTLLQVFGPWAVVQIAVSCLYGHVVWRQNICVCVHVL